MSEKTTKTDVNSRISKEAKPEKSVIKKPQKSSNKTSQNKISKEAENFEQKITQKASLKEQKSELKRKLAHAKPNPAKTKRALANKELASKEVVESKANLTNKKLISALKVIESISHTLGISDRERINFDIEEISQNELNVRIVNGTANFKSPWFAIKNEEPYVLMPAEILDMVLKMLRTAQNESFGLKLERSILQQMPFDVGDVWQVVAQELKNSPSEPDVDKLVRKVKAEHPNLFMNLSDLEE